MELCNKCIHTDVCKNKDDMDKLSDEVMEILTKPNNSTFGVSLNCDYYKKNGMFGINKKNKKKYNGV